MDNPIPQTIGIDISKTTLDVYAYPAGCERQFTNTAKGHRELVGWLAQWPIDRVAYEATGAYHRQLEQALADLPCVKLNPARARRFAQALGTIAKTDKIDAVILARMATTLQPPVRPASTPQQAKLAELISARDGLVRDKIALQNQAKKPDAASPQTSAQKSVWIRSSGISNRLMPSLRRSLRLTQS